MSLLYEIMSSHPVCFNKGVSSGSIAQWVECSATIVQPRLHEILFKKQRVATQDFHAQIGSRK